MFIYHVHNKITIKQFVSFGNELPNVMSRSKVAALGGFVRSSGARTCLWSDKIDWNSFSLVCSVVLLVKPVKSTGLVQ